LEEIPRVREELGYPPLVTPTSQIVGTQAVLNVLTGERYKLVPGEVKAYVQGLYGKPPAPVDPEIARRILGDKAPITCRPADLLEPRLAKARNEIKDLARSEDDIISYAVFPQVTRKFLEERKSGQNAGTGPKPGDYRQFAGVEEDINMNFQQIKELVNLINQTEITEFSLKNNDFKLAIKKAGAAGYEAPSGDEHEPVAVPERADTPAQPAAEPSKTGDLTGGFVVKSPMVGTFYRAPAPEAAPFVEVGSRVEKGQTLCIIEAMKLMNEIEAEVSGTVVEILVENAQPVEYGQPLIVIKED
jgi:oxaloacetate decarboxylase alpha subunit